MDIKQHWIVVLPCYCYSCLAGVKSDIWKLAYIYIILPLSLSFPPLFSSNPFVVVCMFWSVLFLVFSLWHNLLHSIFIFFKFSLLNKNFCSHNNKIAIAFSLSPTNESKNNTPCLVSVDVKQHWTVVFFSVHCYSCQTGVISYLKTKPMSFSLCLCVFSPSFYPLPPIFVDCTFWSVLFLVFSLLPLLLFVCFDLFRSLFLVYPFSVRFDLFCSFGTIYPLCCCLYVVHSDLFCSFDPIYCMAGAAVRWVTLLAELDCLQNLKTRRPG